MVPYTCAQKPFVVKKILPVITLGMLYGRSHPSHRIRKGEGKVLSLKDALNSFSVIFLNKKKKKNGSNFKSIDRGCRVGTQK